METIFEMQCRKYQQQQTVAGSRTQTALDKMARQMQEVIRKPIKSGVLIPLIDDRTGIITRFIER